MSTGADSKTMPGTDAFRDGYDRIFGKDHKPERGTWVQDPVTGQLVPANEYQPPASTALNAPVMVDRFMENSSAQDGTDIGSRAKRREYQKRNGVVDASDVSSEFCRKRRAEKEQATAESTLRTVTELSKVERHNLPNAVEQLRRKR